MSDSLKKHDKWEQRFKDDTQTVTSLRQDIERLQRDISKLYTEELFMARIKISELELKVRQLEKENFSLLARIPAAAEAEVDVNHSSGEDDDWYTSHGQGD